MADWSSEKIAKALKGSGFTPSQRISTAIDAWNNDKIFFPNKDDFLFDWLCFVLAAKPNLKNLSESPLFMNNYWKLLTDLFKHYNHQSKLQGQQQFTIPFIRVPLVVTVSTVLQHIYSTFKNDSTLRRALVHDLVACIQILLSDTFRHSYHPTLEQMTTLIENLLAALSRQVELVQQNEGSNDEISTLDELVELAQVSLKRYDDQLIQAGNQKKMYTTIVTKLLPVDLHVRRQLMLMATTRENYSIVAQQLTNILCHVLFHADTILEYTSVLKDHGNVNNMKNASYVSKLFEELSKAASNSTSVETVKDALSILPVLLSQFIKSFREKRHTKMAPTQGLNRQAEFGFFMQVYDILEMGKMVAFETFLKVEAQLLEQVLVLNIYSARNDDIAKQQHEFLDSLAQHVVDYLENSQECNQGFVFDITKYLLQIDISLIENRMAFIWPALLLPSADSDSCLSLAQTVLTTYAASRQIDVFVNELLDTVANASFQDVYVVLNKPLFTKAFLKEFSSIVAKYVPAPQMLTIFERFTDALKINLDPRKTLSDYDDNLRPKKKKAKHDQKYQQQIGRNSNAMLVTTFFVEFISSLRLGYHQRQAFERTSVDLFEQFLSPSLCNTMNVEQSVLPALQVHFALSNAFYDVYWLQLSKNSREWLVNELKSLYRLECRGQTLSSRMFLVHCTSVLLQHVYFSTLNSTSISPSNKNADLVSAVLNMVMDENETQWQSSSWDGQLVSLKDMDCVRLAIWKLVTDEWLEPVCRVIQDDSRRTQSFAYLVLLSTIQQKQVEYEPSTFTMQSLNTALLRSANFYEIQCFNDLSVDMILKMLIQLFRDKSTQGGNSTRGKMEAEIAKIKLDEVYVQDKSKLSELGNTLLGTLVEAHDQDMGPPMQSMVDTICRLVNLLLLFPVEYFGRQERSYMLWLSLLVDAWLFSGGNATPSSIIRGSLACRSLYLRFVNITNAGALQTNSSILHWWVHVLDSKFTEDTIRSIKADVNAWTQVTKLMDSKVQSIVLPMAASKNPDVTVAAIIQDTLQNRFGATSTDGKLPLSFKWTLNFMGALVDYLPNLIKKQDNIANSNLLGTLPEMLKVSQLICKLLQQGSQSLQSDADGVGMSKEIPASEFASLFHGARLVLDYGRILKLNGKEIDVTELSEIVTRLVSPVVSHLQACPLSQSNANMHDSLNMAVSFAGAICMTLSQQDQTDTTKRILSVIWVVTGLAYESKNALATQSIGDIFSKWIQNLPQEQYSILVDSFMEQMKCMELQAVDDQGRITHHTFVSLVYLLLTKSTDGQKRQLLGMIPSFLLKLTVIAGTATNIEFLDESLDLLVRFTNEKVFINNAYDVSLVLSCLLRILQPRTYTILGSQLDRDLAHTLFGKICFVLVNLARLHRDPLSDNMGSMVALLQYLLQCFKSAQLSLVSHKKNTDTKKRKVSTMGSTSASAPTAAAAALTGLLAPHAPLDSTAAERYARICSQLTVKSSGSKRGDLVQHNISKHVPYILMNYFAIQSDPIVNITQPALKTALSFGLYELLDICSSSDRTIIMSSLNPTGQAIFKSFYSTWKAEHKYSGQ